MTEENKILNDACINFLNESARPLAKLHGIADVMYATMTDTEICAGTVHQLGDTLLDYITELENRRKDLNKSFVESQK